MTRDQYIVQLAQALDFMEEEARAAALSFYTEMLDDRMEDGMEEEAAVAAMDSPEAIARRMKNEPLQKHEGPMADFPSIADQARQALESAMKATGEMLQNAGSMAHAAADRAGEAIHSAAQAIREEIKKGAEGEYDQHLFTCPAQDVHALSISAQDMPIRIFPSADDQIHLTYYSCQEDPYAVTLQDGVLTLCRTGGEKKKGFRFSLFNLFQLKLLWNQHIPTMELFLPADAPVELSAVTSNASVQAQGLRALNDTYLHTSNGRIVLDQMQCKSLEMKTSNSRLALSHVASKSFLKGRTSNGRIESRDLTAKDEIRLDTSNGRIQLERCAVQGPLSLSTSNGAVEVTLPVATAISLRTVNGSIRGSLPGPLSSWQIDSATSNGRCSLPRRQEGEKPLSVHTANGNIDLEII